MKTEQIKQVLNPLLSISDLIKLDGFSERTIFRWIKGTKIRVGTKGVPVFSKPIKLKTIKLKSDLLINPEDLVKFLKETKREDLIRELPSYLRK
jgi:predicted DNA-binding transcriptional regulator AlpA